MSSPRDYMDCRKCNPLTGHTYKAGCIIATERAAAANEAGWNASGDHPAATLHPDGTDQWGRPTVPVDREQLARDVIALAQVGGMPDTYWLTDSRISRACAVLGITPEEAREMELPDDDD
jgi:hypothetical protein